MRAAAALKAQYGGCERDLVLHEFVDICIELTIWRVWCIAAAVALAVAFDAADAAAAARAVNVAASGRDGVARAESDWSCLPDVSPLA
jgi:hypothetical protein